MCDGGIRNERRTFQGLLKYLKFGDMNDGLLLDSNDMPFDQYKETPLTETEGSISSQLTCWEKH